MQKDIITEVARKARFTQRDTKILLDTFVEVVKNMCMNLEIEDKFTITNFITMKATKKSAREIVNPNTKQKCDVAEGKRIKIKATTGFLRGMDNPKVDDVNV